MGRRFDGRGTAGSAGVAGTRRRDRADEEGAIDSSLTTLLARARRAWNRALLLSLGGTSLGLTLAVAGAAVITGRVLGTDIARPAIAAALLAAAWLTARRFATRRVDDDQMATLLDLRSGGHGTLLHARAHGLSPADLPELGALTRPRADARRVGRSLGPGLAFLAATLFVPLRLPQSLPHERLAEQRLDELQQLVSQLDEVLQLDDELVAEVRENLDSAQQGLDDQELSGEALMEALDQVEQRLDDARQQTAEALAGARAELARAEAGLAAGADPESLSDELDALAQELSELGALPAGSELSDLSSLSAADLARQLDDAALERLRQMAAEGLLDGSRLAQAGSGRPLPGDPPRPLPEEAPGGT